MAELEKKPVKIVETILRDAHQSQIATRMTTEQMLPIVDKLDKVGYHAADFCTKYSTTSSAYGRYPRIFCPRKSI